MFTDIYIKRLKPVPGKRYIKSESGGLGIRVSESSKTFVLRYTFDGKNKRINIGTYPAISLKEAREKAAAHMVQVERGNDPQSAKLKYKSSPTISDVLKEFWESKLSKLPSGGETHRILTKDILKPWGAKKAADIKKRDIVILLDEVEQRAPVVRNRLQSSITRMFNFAAARGIIDHSPCGGIERVKEKTRSRVLSDEEIILLWQGTSIENVSIDVHPVVKLAIRMILLTGQRPGEVIGTQDTEIVTREDGVWWEIPGERMKNKSKHDVPLSELCMDTIKLARFYSGTSSFLFRSHKTGKATTRLAISRAVDRHYQEMGIDEKFVPHDLRRTCRTGLAALGIDDVVAEKVLSHKLPGVLGIYNRNTYDRERRIALELWSEHIDKLLNPERDISNNNVLDFKSFVGGKK